MTNFDFCLLLQIVGEHFLKFFFKIRKFMIKEVVWWCLWVFWFVKLGEIWQKKRATWRKKSEKKFEFFVAFLTFFVFFSTNLCFFRQIFRQIRQTRKLNASYRLYLAWRVARFASFMQFSRRVVKVISFVKIDFEEQTSSIKYRWVAKT